MLAIMQGRL